MKDSLLRASLTPQWNVAHTLATGGLALTLLGFYLTNSYRIEDRDRRIDDQLQTLTVRLSVVESQQQSAAQAAQELKADLGARITDLQSEVRATNRLLTEMLRSQRTQGMTDPGGWSAQAGQR